jgi:fucose 4-O-acetylase-like acetyltransferase
MVLAMSSSVNPAVSPAVAPAPKTRDPWLDNAKMVLVTIVVVGHLMVLVPDGGEKNHAYDFIYYFHIPAFVLVTGYLSRTFRYSRRHLLALVTTLVVPYIVIGWLMIHWRVLLDEAPPGLEWFQNPRWPMWYLAAVVMWRLVTPIFRWHPLMVVVAIAISLLGGLTNQELFDINRAMGFLPFFVIGLHLQPSHLALLRRPRAWVVGVVGVLFVWWIADHTDDFWSTQFLYFRAPYAELGASDGEGMWIRARLIVVALVGSFAVLALVPRRRSFLTRMGAWSLVVYLCHGFVVRYLEYRGYEDWMPGSTWWSVLLTVAVGIALALLIAAEPVARVLNVVVDPISSIASLRTALAGRGRKESGHETR